MGMAAGQLAGGWFADTVGWRWAFGALVAGYLIVGVLLWREVAQQAATATVHSAAAPRQGFAAQVRTGLGVPWARIVLATVFVEGWLVFGGLEVVPADGKRGGVGKGGEVR